MEVDTSTNWSVDPNEVPGCVINSRTYRYFAKHPDKNWYFLGKPLTAGKLVLTSTISDLTTVMTVPCTGAAVTAMAFVSRKL